VDRNLQGTVRGFRGLLCCAELGVLIRNLTFEGGQRFVELRRISFRFTLTGQQFCELGESGLLGILRRLLHRCGKLISLLRFLGVEVFAQILYQLESTIRVEVLFRPRCTVTTRSILSSFRSGGCIVPAFTLCIPDAHEGVLRAANDSKTI